MSLTYRINIQNNFGRKEGYALYFDAHAGGKVTAFATATAENGAMASILVESRDVPPNTTMKIINEGFVTDGTIDTMGVGLQAVEIDLNMLQMNPTVTVIHESQGILSIQH